MGKISYEDKMRIQTLREINFRCRTIVTNFRVKGWNRSSVKVILSFLADRTVAKWCSIKFNV